MSFGLMTISQDQVSGNSQKMLINNKKNQYFGGWGCGDQWRLLIKLQNPLFFF